MREDTLISRRAALGGALAIGASTLVASQVDFADEKAFAQNGADADEPGSAADESAQYGFLFKAKNCIDCGECVSACRLWSRTPESAEARRTVTPYTTKTGKEVFISTSCMHCAVPACASVCPAGAIAKGEGGIVTVNKDRCIGCKYCYQACPYGVPHYTATGMDKCDYCLGNGVALGDEPHCVHACKVKALFYGTLDDLIAETKGKGHPMAGSTGPSFILV